MFNRNMHSFIKDLLSDSAAKTYFARLFSRGKSCDAQSDPVHRKNTLNDVTWFFAFTYPGVWSQGQEAWLLFEKLCQRWREFCRFFSQLCTYFVLKGFFKLFFLKWYNSIFVAWMLIFLSHHTIVKFLTWKRLFNVYKRYYLKFTSTFVVIESILGTDVLNFCDDYS